SRAPEAMAVIELTGHTGLVVALAYAPDGRTLASASSDGTARLWDLATGRLVATLQSKAERAHCVAFAPDGRSLAGRLGGQCGGGGVGWGGWGWRGGVDSGAAHDLPTRGRAFSPDGTRLATTGSDKEVRLWDLPRLRVQLARRVGASPAHAVAI